MRDDCLDLNEAQGVGWVSVGEMRTIGQPHRGGWGLRDACGQEGAVSCCVQARVGTGMGLDWGAPDGEVGFTDKPGGQQQATKGAAAMILRQ